MNYVVAIDVGVKNLGLCVYDLVRNKITHWEVVSLVPNGTYHPYRNVDYIRDFIHKFTVFFDNAYRILIERQMRCNMRIIESVLHSLFYDKVTIINARSVKLHYDLGMRNYRANKQKAVAWAEEFVQSNRSAFDDGALKNWKQKGKRDDLADSLSMAMYYLDTYSDCLDRDSPHVELEEGQLL